MGSRGFRQLKNDRKRGVSMAVVLCVSAFFVAFAAAILYTAGVLSAQSTQRLKEERCYQLAKSYSNVLEAELEKYSTKGATEAANSFYAFANQFLDRSQYLEYDPTQPETTQYNYITSGTADLSDLSTTTDLDPGYGNLRITLRKEENASESGSSLRGTIEASSDATGYNTVVEGLKNTKIRQYLFTVQVTAYQEDSSYTYSTEYFREETYNVKFTHNGNVIVWDGTNWKKDNTSGQIYTPDFNLGKIQYEYQTDQSTSCNFIENTYTEEKGGTDNGESSQ